MAKNNKNTSKNRMSDTVNKKPKMKKKKSSLKEKIIIAVSIIAAVIIIAVMVLNIPIIPVERTKDGLTYTEDVYKRQVQGHCKLTAGTYRSGRRY